MRYTSLSVASLLESPDDSYSPPALPPLFTQSLTHSLTRSLSLPSAVGSDIAGTSLIAHCSSFGMRTDGIRVAGAGAGGGSTNDDNNNGNGGGSARTATYTAMFHGDGELLCAVADMDIMEKQVR